MNLAACIDAAPSGGGHMQSYDFRKHKQAGLRVAHIAFASLAALMVANDPADAARLQSGQSAVSRSCWRANHGDCLAA